MNPAKAAEQCLRDGDPAGALAQLQEAVRAKPDDSKLRIFLFQLLSVMGQWERALNQLNVAAELDPGALAMAQMYREALHCEVLRTQVFEGKKSPLVFGQPEQWLALLIEALLLTGQGKHREAGILRTRALDEASATTGTLDDQPFTWIADADTRLGPVCEAIINGRYYWVPFSRLTGIVIDAPEDLRDVVLHMASRADIRTRIEMRGQCVKTLSHLALNPMRLRCNIFAGTSGFPLMPRVPSECQRQHQQQTSDR